MPNFSEEVSDFDRQMTAFLDNAGNNGDGDEKNVDSNVKPGDIDPREFFSEEESAGVTESTDNPVPVQPSASQNTTVPSQITREMLEYEIRLAEERGRAAGISTAMTSLTNQNKEPEPDPNAGFYKPEEIEFSEEEQKLDPIALSFAAKVARREVDRVLSTVVKPLQTAVSEQAQQLANYSDGVARTNSRVLYSQVQTIIPDLPQVVESPEWKSYLNQPNPFDSSITLGNTFLQHLYAGRTNDIVNIIKQFKSQQPSAKQQGQVSPGRSSVGTPPVTPTTRGKPLFSKAKYDAAFEAWQSGRMTYSEFSKVSDLYQEAALEGRVVDK